MINFKLKRKSLFTGCILVSVNAANNLRYNSITYHDVIATERWEMRFFGFFLGLCEANAFNSFRTFSKDGEMDRKTFKDTLAYTLLKHCKELIGTTTAKDSFISRMSFSKVSTHTYVTMCKLDSNKRIRLACKSCTKSGVIGTGVGKTCECNPTIPLCKPCYKGH